MIGEIKVCKYFSIILDCTPDISHTEQLSVVISIVSVDNKPQVKEHCMGFLEAEASTGEQLSALILKRLEDLNIPFNDCRGQSYDNGANMRGKRKGVQARLLAINPRALFVPCAAHTLNLVVADAARSSQDAIGYFGYLQNMFTLFSASTQRWSILKSHVNITLKSWSDTRWESRVNSVEAVRYQAPQVREALLEVKDKAADPVIRIEAQSLAIGKRKASKAATIAKEMVRYNLSVLGLGETRWTPSGEVKLPSGQSVIYSGHEEDGANHTEGVAIMMTKRKALIAWEPISSCLITASFRTNNRRVKTHIIQCYAPTNDALDDVMTWSGENE
ncbi:hypothetical protein NHX12_004929 [Muraenolepis orangiensis]|uniref:DUF4371 domain-containing protein n=1 Tax=Muraenolepis orangiensis TaxID=630683 RepID=A0A9Q0DW51_9TELE|nr:hypothetical protein NHX12_004929 [Muraenolepis orangiensis]